MNELNNSFLDLKGVITAILIVVVLIICKGCHRTGSDHVSDQPPNILIITMDNLGYGDHAIFNRNSQAKTPNIDLSATQGARLTSFYTVSPTCTASRVALLTGRIR